MINKFWDWFKALDWYWKVLFIIFLWPFYFILIPLYTWTSAKWSPAIKWGVTALTLIVFVSMAIASPSPQPTPDPQKKKIEKIKSETTTKIKPKIKKTRITYKTETTTEAIPFVEQHIQDSNLDKGKSELRQEGVSGIKTKYYQVTLRDGDETTRTFNKEEITLKPVPKIIADGIKEPPPPPPPTPTPSPVVYITKTGARYHQAHPDGCHSYLSRSKIAVSKSQAIAQGLTPCQCSLCNW